MNKNKKFSIRLTEQEQDRIKKKANGKPMSQYCRSVLLNEMAGGLMIATELTDIRRELASLGNNINQIAKRVNSGEDIDISRLPEIINDLRNEINKKLARVR